MKKYILVSGEKGSYDRPIKLGIEEIFNTLEEASSYMVEKYVYPDEKILTAIKGCEKNVSVNYNTYYLGYTNNLLSYYSTGCPADNEYGGVSYRIFEVSHE